MGTNGIFTQMKTINCTPYTDPIGYQLLEYHLGVSNNRGTLKWMICNGKTLLKWMIGGGTLFLETPIFIYAA